MSILKKFLAVATAAFLMAGAVQADTMKFCVTDINGLEELQVHYGAFVEVLEEITGDEVEFFPVNNRTAARGPHPTVMSITSLRDRPSTSFFDRAPRRAGGCMAAPRLLHAVGGHQ